MRKHPVLLLELVIALTLFAAIIGILMSSFRELTLAKSTLRKEKEVILTRQKLQLRLSQIFSATTELKFENGNCLLTYNNGLDPDLNFRGSLEGLLYIDKGRLAFVSWSEKGLARKEILYESTDSFSLSFFDEKKNWSPEYPSPKPFMMKIKLPDVEIPLFL